MVVVAMKQVPQWQCILAFKLFLQVDSAPSFLPLSIYQFEATSRAAGSIGVI
jgi:hypothetical protein